MAGYTFKTYQNPNNLGAMGQDANKQPVGIPNGVQTQDATGTPVVSPNNIPNGSVTTLSVPEQAVNFCIIPLTNTVNVSEADNTVATNYLTAPTGVVTKIPCVRMAALYLKANTGAATNTTFWFEVV